MVKPNTKADMKRKGIHRSKRISHGPLEINKELLSRVLAKISGEMLLGFWLCTCGSCEPQFWQKVFSLGLMK
jgi:hypothetical protein